MSQHYRKPRLFMNHQAAPRIGDDIARCVNWWISCGCHKRLGGRRTHQQGRSYHLIFSIWAQTQHYADFDVQVRYYGEKLPVDG
jgi:TetR/AcrR family transcriptional regulator